LFSCRLPHLYASACCAAIFVAVAPHSLLAEAITATDIRGLKLNAEVVREQSISRRGRKIKITMRQDWDVSVVEDNFVKFSVETTARGPGGTRKLSPTVGKIALGQPREVAGRGGGEAMWSFVDSTLIFIRTYPEGAFRIRFQLSRTAHGLKCTANAAFARENGTGEIKIKSPASGELTTVLSSRQLSTNCKATKMR
jgi:hypothetical protein